MQTLYLFITFVYGIEDTTVVTTTQEFTRLIYWIVHTICCILFKTFSLTTQTSVSQTTGTQNGNPTSLCFENVESSRVDEDKIILKDPDSGNEFNHFELLFGGIGSFTYDSYEML